MHKFHIAVWEFMPLRGLVLVGFDGNENNVGRLGSVESTMQALEASSRGSFRSQSSRKPSDKGKENQLTMDVEKKTVPDVEGTYPVTINAEEKFGSDLDLRTTLTARSSSPHSQAMIQQTLNWSWTKKHTVLFALGFSALLTDWGITWGPHCSKLRL